MDVDEEGLGALARLLGVETGVGVGVWKHYWFYRGTNG